MGGGGGTGSGPNGEVALGESWGGGGGGGNGSSPSTIVENLPACLDMEMACSCSVGGTAVYLARESEGRSDWGVNFGHRYDRRVL